MEEEGQTACNRCTEEAATPCSAEAEEAGDCVPFSTRLEAAGSVDECVCPVDSYYNAGTQLCSACITGLRCPGGFSVRWRLGRLPHAGRWAC
jgi:hypothetical protein